MSLSTYVLVPPFIAVCSVCNNYHFFSVPSPLKLVGSRRYSMRPNLVYREAVSVVEHCIYLIVVSQAWLVHSHGFVTCCKSAFMAVYSSLHHQECQHFLV